MLGLRVLETQNSTIRLFLQIWESVDGSVAWEGAQESTVSHESMAEEYVSMKSIVQESARDLVGHLPGTSTAARAITESVPGVRAPDRRAAARQTPNPP